MQDKPKIDEIIIEGIHYIPFSSEKGDRIHDLENEVKSLTHRLKFNQRNDEIARKVVASYKKFAYEFIQKVSSAEFDEWWEKPPCDIPSITDTEKQ